MSPSRLRRRLVCICVMHRQVPLSDAAALEAYTTIYGSSSLCLVAIHEFQRQSEIIDLCESGAQLPVSAFIHLAKPLFERQEARNCPVSQRTSHRDFVAECRK